MNIESKAVLHMDIGAELGLFFQLYVAINCFLNAKIRIFFIIVLISFRAW